MNEQYMWSKYRYNGAPNSAYASCDVRVRIPEEFQKRQESGRDITKDDITNLRITLETSTVDEFLEVI